MSVNTQSDIIQSVAALILDNRLAIAAVVLLIYDQLITFGREVQYVWLRKKTGATLLFIFIRYTAFLCLALLDAISYTPDMSDERSARVSSMRRLLFNFYHISCGRVRAIAFLPTFTVPTTFSALRALALSDMNWALASIVFVIGCGPTVINLWGVFGIGLVGQTIPLLGCVAAAQPTASQAKM
ncbi:hypothetical protein ONZ51_g12440 [Trametes cubensis]|uniref:DUF6533 domain-containing protein n=1 Tax=Trametes cubensis TaxID=1111947 RepID=A0AAD7TIA1_9APHY|nr:hypothetical protein ONZ51_g12440 [Trametes cubensis]